MTEGEFRDWARGRLQAFEERLKAIEARGEPERLRIKVGPEEKGKVLNLARGLLERSTAGKVAAVGIAFISDEGLAHTGWAGDGDGFALAGAVHGLSLRITGRMIGPEDDEEGVSGQEK
jgi:hypothetical protein